MSNGSIFKLFKPYMKRILAVMLVAASILCQSALAQDLKERTSNGGGLVRINPADSLEAGEYAEIFTDSAGCLPGGYQLGLELHHDRGDLLISGNWSYEVRLALVDTLKGDTLQKDTLLVGSDPEIRISSLLYDDTVSCNRGFALKVMRIKTTGTVPMENVRLESRLYRLDLIDFERDVVFDAWHRSAGIEKELIYWTHAKGAHSYDLEWVFLDDFELEACFDVNSDTTKEAFARKGGISINTTEQHYEVPLHYPEKGRLYFRVRAIGVLENSPHNQQIQGDWNYGLVPGGFYKALDEAFEKDMMWQRVTSFAEDGKQKSIITYFDGSGRSRQVQTDLSTDATTLIGETFYDYEGRSVVSPLPVPVKGSSLAYRESFNVFNSVAGLASGKHLYDNEDLENANLKKTSGAGQYYSPANDVGGVHRDHIPNANGWAYAQTSFINDNTGRTARQSGVGRIFRLDSAHATAYHYGMPNSSELHRLFGSNVGQADHYKKTLVVDPNGQVSVSYMDQEGRTIATSLAGESPDNLEELAEKTALATNAITVPLNSHNEVDIKNRVSRLSYEFLHTTPVAQDYTFNYDLSATSIQLAEGPPEELIYQSDFSIDEDDFLSLRSAQLQAANDHLQVTGSTSSANSGLRQIFHLEKGQQYKLRFKVSKEAAQNISLYVYDRNVTNPQLISLASNRLTDEMGEGTFLMDTYFETFEDNPQIEMRLAVAAMSAGVFTLHEMSIYKVNRSGLSKKVILDEFNEGIYTPWAAYGSDLSVVNKKLQVSRSAAAGNRSGALRTFDVVPGKTYRLSADIFNEDKLGASTEFSLSHVLSDGSTLRTMGNWYYFPKQGSITFTASTEKLRLYIWLHDGTTSPATGSHFEIDNVSLKELPSKMPPLYSSGFYSNNHGYTEGANTTMSTSSGALELSAVSTSSTFSASRNVSGLLPNTNYNLRATVARTDDKIVFVSANNSGVNLGGHGVLAFLGAGTYEIIVPFKTTDATSNDLSYTISKSGGSSLKVLSVSLERAKGIQGRSDTRAPYTFDDAADLTDWPISNAPDMTAAISNGRLKLTNAGTAIEDYGGVKHDFKVKKGSYYELSFDIDGSDNGSLINQIFSYHVRSNALVGYAVQGFKQDGRHRFRFRAMEDEWRIIIRQNDIPVGESFYLDNIVLEEMLPANGHPDTTCVDCDYSLRIALYGPDGLPVDLNGTSFGTEITKEITPDCVREKHSEEFTVRLDEIGNYKLVKELTLSPVLLENIYAAVDSATAEEQARIYTNVELDSSLCDDGSDYELSEAERDAIFRNLARTECERIYDDIVEMILEDGTITEVTDAMVQAHPAYCRYTYCIGSIPGKVWDYKLQAFKGGWAAAEVAGWTDPLGTEGHATPQLDSFFFNPSIIVAESGATNYHTIMKDSLEEVKFPKPDASAWVTTSLWDLLVESNSSFHDFSGTHSLYKNMKEGETKDARKWALFKAFYQQRKRAVENTFIQAWDCDSLKDDKNKVNSLMNNGRSVTAMKQYFEQNMMSYTTATQSAQAKAYLAMLEGRCDTIFNRSPTENDAELILSALQAYLLNRDLQTNPFGLILQRDLVAEDANLITVENVLAKYGCSLFGFAIPDPFQCEKYTKIYEEGPPTMAPFFWMDRGENVSYPHGHSAMELLGDDFTLEAMFQLDSPYIADVPVVDPLQYAYNPTGYDYPIDSLTFLAEKGVEDQTAGGYGFGITPGRGLFLLLGDEVITTDDDIFQVVRTDEVCDSVFLPVWDSLVDMSSFGGDSALFAQWSGPYDGTDFVIKERCFTTGSVPGIDKKYFIEYTVVNKGLSGGPTRVTTNTHCMAMVSTSVQSGTIYGGNSNFMAVNLNSKGKLIITYEYDPCGGNCMPSNTLPHAKITASQHPCHPSVRWRSLKSYGCPESGEIGCVYTRKPTVRDSSKIDYLYIFGIDFNEALAAATLGELRDYLSKAFAYRGLRFGHDPLQVGINTSIDFPRYRNPLLVHPPNSLLDYVDDIDDGLATLDLETLEEELSKFRVCQGSRYTKPGPGQYKTWYYFAGMECVEYREPICHHAAVTVKRHPLGGGYADSIAFFLDGVVVKSLVYQEPSGLATASNPSDLTIGRNLTGAIQEFRAWDKVIPPRKLITPQWRTHQILSYQPGELDRVQEYYKDDLKLYFPLNNLYVEVPPGAGASYGSPTVVTPVDPLEPVTGTVKSYGYVGGVIKEAPASLNGFGADLMAYRTLFVKNKIWSQSCMTAPSSITLDSFCSEYNEIVVNNLFTFELNTDSIKSACLEELKAARDYEALRLVNEYRDSMATVYIRDLSHRCFDSLREKTQMQYIPGEYHFTLYYYDQAGSLVQTVPPEGVKPLDDTKVQKHNKVSERQRLKNEGKSWGYVNTVMAVDYAGVADPVATDEPGHTFLTQYKYNTLGQLTWQETPDAGVSRFWYDSQGSPRLSQNAQQELDDAYSYIKYDNLLRVIEVGEMGSDEPLTSLTAQMDDVTFPLKDNYTPTQLTFTFYDDAIDAPLVANNFAQNNLRNRVSWMATKDKASDSELKTATFYSYDPHGNVDELLQWQEGLKAKKVEYSYDLMSGNTNLVCYQTEKADAFYHRYYYDSDNRITSAHTSIEGWLWQEESTYKYYRHGALARSEIGEYKVQGLDHYYTLDGWRKGLNDNVNGDIGGDGSSNRNEWVNSDACAYALNYFHGDYKGINQDVSNELTSYSALYNGNVGSMITDLKHFGANSKQGMRYSYDQLSRIKSGQNMMDNGSSVWNSTQNYQSTYGYSKNGNLLELNRKNDAGIVIHDLDYIYYAETNKLKNVDGTSAENYTYDAMGNLISDDSEDIESVEWTYYGKVKKVIKSDDSYVDYTYNAEGNRVSKTVVKDGSIDITRYVHDAVGNIVALYKETNVQERSIYGSSRIGIFSGKSIPGELELGIRTFELSNHLGNVLTTVSDKKIAVDIGADMHVDYFQPEILSASNYYPFGLAMSGRDYSAEEYRFGFNGYEKDKALFGSAYDFGERLYNSKIGKFLSIDPLTAKYPSWSPYQYAGNCPVIIKDLLGMGPENPNPPAKTTPVEAAATVIWGYISAAVEYTTGYKIKPVLEIQTKAEIGVAVGAKLNVYGVKGQAELGLVKYKIWETKTDMFKPITQTEGHFFTDKKGAAIDVEQSVGLAFELPGKIAGSKVFAIGGEFKHAFSIRSGGEGSMNSKVTPFNPSIEFLGTKRSTFGSSDRKIDLEMPKTLGGLGEQTGMLQSPGLSKGKGNKDDKFVGTDFGVKGMLLLGIEIKLRIGVEVEKVKKPETGDNASGSNTPNNEPDKKGSN